MCEAASMILLKDRVLIGNVTNSHREILEQNRLEDVELEPNFVKIEITPPWVDGLSNYYAPLSEWEYKVDQDYLPDWYVSEYDEGRVREELVRWYREHIEMQHTDAPDLVQKAGEGAIQVAGYSANQKAGDNASQVAGYDSTQVAGRYSNQSCGEISKQKAGVGTVQIGRWTDINGDTKVATRVVTEEEADKWYHFDTGVWTLIK